MSESSRAQNKKITKPGIDFGEKAGAGSTTKASTGAIKKNPIESVITTLPIIMLLGGLAFYYFNERRQVDGQILMEFAEEIQGNYAGISQQSEKPDAQRILWIKTPSRLRGGRIDFQQAQKLNGLTDGDPLTIWAAPKVQGSKTLWVVRASTSGKLILESAVSTEIPSTIQTQ